MGDHPVRRWRLIDRNYDRHRTPSACRAKVDANGWVTDGVWAVRPDLAAWDDDADPLHRDVDLLDRYYCGSTLWEVTWPDVIPHGHLVAVADPDGPKPGYWDAYIVETGAGPRAVGRALYDFVDRLTPDGCSLWWSVGAQVIGAGPFWWIDPDGKPAAALMPVSWNLDRLGRLLDADREARR